MSDIVNPPCDCIEEYEPGKWWARCYCSNRDDGESASVWAADKNREAEMSALRATITSLRAELERKDAALREAKDYITDDAVWLTGPVENRAMEVVDIICAALSAQVQRPTRDEMLELLQRSVMYLHGTPLFDAVVKALNPTAQKEEEA